MLVMVILFIELLSVFLCVFRVYGQKPKVDVKGIIAFGMMFAILNIVNYFELNSIYSFVAYLVLLIYCKIEFKEYINQTVASIFLAIVISTIIQFIGIIFITLWETEYLLIRTLLGNVACFLVIVFILPYCKLNKLREAICRRHWLTYLIVLFVLLVTLLPIVFMKIEKGLSISLFFFGIPSLVIIFFLIMYWDKALSREKQMKKEISTLKEMEENYENLVLKVRENQHEFKNHMVAFKSSHYPHISDKELEITKDEYINYIEKQNNYNNIILLENKILCGFLFGKICEMERLGINVLCKVNTKIVNYKIPSYYLIELLGIMLDNATEDVVHRMSRREVICCIDKTSEGYCFTIKNPHDNVSYETIKGWFKQGYSTKGKDRGIGLYRLNQICIEWDCSIACRNEEDNKDNWVVFEVTVKEDGA